MSTANEQVTLFDDEFLKKLEYLNIISKRLFAGQLRAERRTRKRGTGLEFADYRAYVAGANEATDALAEATCRDFDSA